ncbi:hypothetical protein PVAP13_1NG127600 [Panicum virgatum]|uniref:DUF3615 domain-containing protein n=1 Tax=Panicum virgatum TaxID=38727 RepID=A0A8T0WL65_PANVG|nr:hypothetical protein PVAP13_1NG127600 [Panicum virgatum]
MAAAGGGPGGHGEEPAPPPVQYHMSDDEEDKALYAAADGPQVPTSPVYSRSPAPIWDDSDDDMVDAAAGGYSSSDDDEAGPDGLYEYEELPSDPAAAQRQAEKLAGYALHHYNADPSNAIKYELVEATESNYILAEQWYGHVNFVARPCGGAGKERLFFAEVHGQLHRDTMVPTCLRSLDSEDDRVGGIDDEPWEVRIRADGARYCFACHGAIKHPKDGTCYKARHRMDQLPLD